MTDCSHLFHKVCISQIRSTNCPVCRTKLTFPENIHMEIEKRMNDDKESRLLQEELGLLINDIQDYVSRHDTIIFETGN